MQASNQFSGEFRLLLWSCVELVTSCLWAEASYLWADVLGLSSVWGEVLQLSFAPATV